MTVAYCKSVKCPGLNGTNFAGRAGTAVCRSNRGAGETSRAGAGAGAGAGGLERVILNF